MENFQPVAGTVNLVVCTCGTLTGPGKAVSTCRKDHLPWKGALTQLQEGAERTLACGKGSYKSQSHPIYPALPAKRRDL